MTSLANADLIARLLQVAESEQIKRHYDYAALLTDAASAIAEARLAALDEAAEIARLAPSLLNHPVRHADRSAFQYGKDCAFAAILKLKETPDAE